MNVTIKKMEKDHLAQIKDALKEHFDEFWNANVLQQELDNPLSTYIVALEAGEVVGYAGIWNPFDEAHITNIVTKKEKRGKQIASKMLEVLIKIAKEKKLRSITLEVNENNQIAIHLYKKFHFQEEGKRIKYYNNTDDAIIMTLTL